MNADLTAIIAEVLADHGYAPSEVRAPNGIQGCGCGWTFPKNFVWFPDWTDHAAEQITARLVAADWIGECLWESR